MEFRKLRKMFVYLGFYEEESRFSVFVVLREEGGGKVLKLKRMNGAE